MASSSPAVGASSCPIKRKHVLLDTTDDIEVVFGNDSEQTYKLYRGTVLSPYPTKGDGWFVFEQILKVDVQNFVCAYLPNMAIMRTLSIDDRITKRAIDDVGTNLQIVINTPPGPLSNFIGLNAAQLEDKKNELRKLSPDVANLTPIEDINRAIESVAPQFSFIDAKIAEWTVAMSKPKSAGNGSCVVAGGRRRRHKKSRRTRSTRKRRQTRSK
jgi:hypothetical protein